MPAIAFAIQALTAIPELISAGMDVVDLVNQSNDALKKMQSEKRDPTDEEWGVLNKTIDALRASRPSVE